VTKEIQRRGPRYAPEPVGDTVWWTPEIGSAAVLIGLGVTVAWPIGLLAVFPLVKAGIGQLRSLADAHAARELHRTGGPAQLDPPAGTVQASAVRLDRTIPQLTHGEDGPR
jgi:hypothetical protein